MEPDRTDRVVERFLRGSQARQQDDDGSQAEILPLPAADELSHQFPQRYLIREADGGGLYLTSRETPELNWAVQVVRRSATMSLTS